jgi:hypothetical protein
MVFQTVCFTLVLCSSLLLCGTRAAKPEEGGLNFAQAIQAVNSQKGQSGNINYDAFCQEKVDKTHDQLLGCQLPAPNAGFELRVCKLETGTLSVVVTLVAMLIMVVVMMVVVG